MGRLILEALESSGDEPSLVGGGDGSGRDLEDSPGPGPPASFLRHRGRGPRSHPRLISPESLRLLRYGCWGQCRLRNCRQVQRMGIGSPGSVWVLHIWSAESDPGTIARTTPGTYHVCSLGVLQGQNRLSAGHG